MRWRDYHWIKRNFHTSVSNDGRILFEPKNENPNLLRRLKMILKRHGMDNISPEEFTNKIRHILHVHNAEEILRPSLVKTFQSLSAADAMRMADEKKVRYIDAVVPEIGILNDDEIRRIIFKNRENLQASLFTFKLPNDFVKKERKNLEKFCKKIYQMPDLEENIKNWDKKELGEKLEFVNKVAKVFAKVYGIEFVEFKTFDDDLYRRMTNSTTDFIPAAHKTDTNIYIHEDRLRKSDNYFPITITFHQCTHIYQDVADFAEFPTIEKLMDEKFNHLMMDPDLNLLRPRERHAYLMQFELERKLKADLGVEKTRNKYDEQYKDKVDKILNNARTIAYYSGT